MTEKTPAYVDALHRTFKNDRIFLSVQEDHRVQRAVEYIVEFAPEENPALLNFRIETVTQRIADLHLVVAHLEACQHMMSVDDKQAEVTAFVVRRATSDAYTTKPPGVDDSKHLAKKAVQDSALVTASIASSGKFVKQILDGLLAIQKALCKEAGTYQQELSTFKG